MGKGNFLHWGATSLRSKIKQIYMLVYRNKRPRDTGNCTPMVVEHYVICKTDTFPDGGRSKRKNGKMKLAKEGAITAYRLKQRRFIISETLPIVPITQNCFNFFLVFFFYFYIL